MNAKPEYGCHFELDPDMKPDGCVLDYGCLDDCELAQRLVAGRKDKWSCHEWRPITVEGAKP